jgi:regulator of protease activity HflC (stomatin/prohibitin superfamily)
MTRVTVPETLRAVVRVDGRVVAVLGPGRHRLPRGGFLGARRDVRSVDVRQRVLLVAGQELTSADVPGVRVTVGLRWKVTDPAAHLDVAADPLDHLRLAVQVALRDAVARRTLDALTAERAQVAAELAAALAGPAAEVGVEVLDVDLRDVGPPGEVRRALLGLVTARTEGLAALERARGETAALRALANGARVLADHPGLLQLRTAQVVGASGGTVVLRGDGTGADLP